ncbi:MAG TPA: VOC family protein [Actinomycetota bacterium]|nr:VOC family protein [Actinomycetota bacterium]
MSETMTGITRVGNVGVPTADQGRALAYYEGTLGFEKIRDMPFGGGLRWIEVAPPGSATTIAILPTPPGAPVGVDTAIRLFTPDAGATHAQLKAAGADLDDVMNFGAGVPPMFTFRDSEGNTLYIVQG